MSDEHEMKPCRKCGDLYDVADIVGFTVHQQGACLIGQRDALRAKLADEVTAHASTCVKLHAARADFANACDVGRRQEQRAERLEAALRRARGVLADIIKAEDERNEAASKCCDEGLIDRDCADGCPQDDTCDCPGTALISQAINRRNFHEGDCLRAIDAALSK